MPLSFEYFFKKLLCSSSVRSENFRFTSEVNTGKVQSNLNRGMVITGCRSTEGSAEIWIGSDLGLCGLLSFLATEQIRSCKDQENRILNNKELVLRVRLCWIHMS